MIPPKIAPLPPAPVRADAPDEFSAKADAMVGALQPFANQANVLAEFVNTRASSANASAGLAETARDAAFINADVYATVAEGRAAVAVGKQFQVPSADGFEYIRYRKDSSSTQTEVARFPTPKQVEDAAQQAASAVIAVDGQVAVAQGAADRAETARDAAFINADVYATVAEGRAAVSVGKQFQVPSTDGFEYIRYRKDSSSAQTEVARYPSTNGVVRLSGNILTNENLDELKTPGSYRTVAANAKQENGYPITGHDCFISVEIAGVYGTIQTVKNVAGDIATRAFRNRWTEWEKSIKATEAPINRGILDGAELRTIMQVGTYYVTNATDFPPDFGKTEGFLRVTQFSTRFEREIIDEFDYSNRYVQVGHAGPWERVGSSGSLDLGDLPKGEVKTDILSKDDILYNSFGSVSARQKTYGNMYEMTNAEVASGDMLATVYSFFDDLVVDFPDYVSMQVLGTENTGLEIREYVILPRKINKMASSPSTINAFPELLLFAGQHGQEYTAIVNLMIFCDEMMRNYNSREIYGTLRTSAILRIMPAMNPWGVKNANRRNSNDVDLNRNFPVGWDNAAGDKGSSPLSEIESVTLSNWVESNKTTAICTLNLHDHSDLALTWGSATAGWPEKLLFRSFQRVGKWYYSNFEDTTLEDPVSWLGNPRDGYADKYIFETLGVPALMFECPYINHPKLGSKISSVRLSSRQILTEVMEMIMGRYFRDLD